MAVAAPIIGLRTRKESKTLFEKAIDSLILCIELFNRPSEHGRNHSTIMLLDHAMEMLLKAAILHKGGRIRAPGEPHTFGFQKCLDVGLSDPIASCLIKDEIVSLQAINNLRDASQHHLVAISEEQLFLHIQNGLTIFRDIAFRVFGVDLADVLPRRVLPVSTVAFAGIHVMFENQTNEIRKLLSPRRRRRQEALIAIRPLAILNGAANEQHMLPSERELERIAQKLKSGEDWATVFPHIAQMECTAESDGLGISLRIDKNAEIAVHFVENAEAVGAALGLKRVNELGFYNLGAKQIAEKLGISQHRFVALRRFLQLENNPEYYKLIEIGSQKYRRYSQKALKICLDASNEFDEEAWRSLCEEFGPRKGRTWPHGDAASDEIAP